MIFDDYLTKELFQHNIFPVPLYIHFYPMASSIPCVYFLHHILQYFYRDVAHYFPMLTLQLYFYAAVWLDVDVGDALEE